MRRRTVWVSLASAALILALAAPQRGQSPPGASSDNARVRRGVAIHTLRAVNMAEYVYRSTHGTFATWEVLVTSEVFSGQNRFVVQNAPQLADVHFSKRPEILPGWALRLNVSLDGKGYDVLLEDTTDKTCAYAAITNESGLIWQSKTFDCDIWVHGAAFSFHSALGGCSRAYCVSAGVDRSEEGGAAVDVD